MIDYDDAAALAAGLTDEEIAGLKRLARDDDSGYGVYAILNEKGGYIGNSTSRELFYARALGKKVRYLEPVEAEK